MELNSTIPLNAIDVTSCLLQRLGFKMPSLQQQNNVNSSNSQKSNHIGNNSSPTTPNGSFVRKQSTKDKEKEREERSKITLLRQPIVTLKYFVLEIVILIQTYRKKLAEHKLLLSILVAFIAVFCALNQLPGRHQLFISDIKSNLWFIIYWCGLGVLSSVGLGTGLHTFLLYLGPHIASVTLAASACNSLNFPEPPYPDEIICPEHTNPNYIPSLWSIMCKVRPEAFLWGAGTALGELPPYFMARASRLSGIDEDEDEDLKAVAELKRKKEAGDNLTIFERLKLGMERIVERVGFLGILACASIPNPLFDLAGITCGHFLVPFWTFFGATLIGKAVIKMHLQKICVIIAFNESLIEKALIFVSAIPYFGKKFQDSFKTFLENQKKRLHRSSHDSPKESSNILSKLFEYFVLLMVCFFVMSIVNSLAQNYHKRIHQKGGKVHRKVAKD
ncbi:Vacuole membrane protein 1 [Pseudolycoriella hygida]|uniref:Vacuole membrane protein 1 n=1 Tax=Pseudolycoriella hygida TaxID=35572 RepID=A0A9Q0MSK6_9DIPT|nr:Vacuole membrane protein 1 [Pseudolycoriella hygida]